MKNFIRSLAALLLLGFAGQVLAPPQFVDVRAFGSVPTDCSADVSVTAQKGIDYMSSIGGGNVHFPYGCYKLNVTVKQSVAIVGQPGAYGYLAGSTPTTRTKFLAAGAGAVIDTPVAATSNVGVIGIDILGLGAGTAVKGIRYRNVTYGFIKDVHVDNVADEGVLVEAPSIINTIDNVLIVNAVLNRTRAAVIGAFDVAGTDHIISRVEATISGSIEGTVQSVNLYCVAIAIRMNTGTVYAVRGQISDVGIYISGSNNQISASRADLNYGHGWLNIGGGNQISNSLGLNNSQDTTNTYDNWQATSASGNNVYTGNRGGNTTGVKVARYDFNDGVTSASAKNKYDNNYGDVSVGTAQFNMQTNNGSGMAFAPGAAKILTVNSATPDVTGYERFSTNNSSGTTITDFTGGTQGQLISVFVGDSNTTIQHNGATISLPGNINKVLISGQTYMFVKSSGLWRIITDPYIQASATYNPPNILAAGTTTTTVTVTGAVLGDFADVSFSLDLQGIVMTTYVNAADTATVVLFNPTAGALDLASGTVRVRVRKI